MIDAPPQTATAHQQDANARAYITALLAHNPIKQGDVGKWAQCCKHLGASYQGNPDNITFVYQTLLKTQPGLRELMAEEHPLQGDTGGGVPELPDSAYLAPDLARGASPCLDLYLAYSKRVSPEGYEYFHEACFLWTLSVVAARRVRIPLGNDYTPLMLAMCAETSLYKKTTTAKAAMKWLYECDLGFLLGAKRTTPQKLIYDMSGIIPKNFSDLDKDKQTRVEQRLAFSGQRGWYNDELGKFIKGTMNENSAMADFQQLLLEMDGCEPLYDNSTISRGTEIVEKPYLALLGSMTPANIAKNAKRGAEFWADGFWARFVFICPPKDTSMDAPFDIGDIPVPGYLIQRLVEWHSRLGVPIVEINPVIDNKNKDTGKVDITRHDSLPEVTCQLGAGVYDAWRRYRSALKQIVTGWHMVDLNGNYERLPTKAMRVAALLASFENDGIIEMRHWALAQAIAERWRAGLHELYAQVNTSREPTAAATLEDEISRHIYRLESDKHLHPSAADLRNYIKQQSVAKIQETCDAMEKAGILTSEKTSHTKRYHLLPVE